MNILVTGASGNIGSELIKSLEKIENDMEVMAGDFDVKRARNTLAEYSNLSFRQLDFNNSATFDKALEGIDIIFLLRPPQLADIEKYFRPFLCKAKEKGIHRVMFLSVQGVENQKFIPHYKLEKLIIKLGFNYIFLRPGYFMQNLTTTLLYDIKYNDRIYIPAGELKLNWVDTADIGKVGARLLMTFDQYKNQPFEITGNEFKGFDEVADMMTRQLNRKISYESPNLFSFYREKTKQGISRPMIFVMIMLHFLPRFKKNKSRLTTIVRDITGDEPNTLIEFITNESTTLTTDN